MIKTFDSESEAESYALTDYRYQSDYFILSEDKIKQLINGKFLVEFCEGTGVILCTEEAFESSYQEKMEAIRKKFD